MEEVKRRKGGGTPFFPLRDRLMELCMDAEEDAGEEAVPWYETGYTWCPPADAVIDWFVEQTETGEDVRPKLRKQLRRKVAKVIAECPRCDIAGSLGI